MGLFKAAIIFLVGNFTLSLLDKHLKKVNTIPVIGDFFGEELEKNIKKNKCMALLIILTFVEFIL